MGKRLSEKEKDLICLLYESGKEPKHISEITGKDESTINRIRKERGIEPRHKERSEAGKKGVEVKRKNAKQNDENSLIYGGENYAFNIIGTDYRVEFTDFSVSSALDCIRSIQDSILDLFYVKD